MILENSIMRKVEGLHYALAKAIHKESTEALDAVIDCDIEFVDQTTLGELVISLKNPSISYTFDVKGLSNR